MAIEDIPHSTVAAMKSPTPLSTAACPKCGAELSKHQAMAGAPGLLICPTVEAARAKSAVLGGVEGKTGLGEPELRELLCQKCGRDYPVWFAPNELWNRVAEGLFSLLVHGLLRSAGRISRNQADCMDAIGGKYRPLDGAGENSPTRTSRTRPISYGDWEIAYGPR